MKKQLQTALIALAMGTCAWAQDVRTTQCLDEDWRFHLGDVADAETTKLDDSSWRTVCVPHDFQIEQPWVAPAADEKADNSDARSTWAPPTSSCAPSEDKRAWSR